MELNIYKPMQSLQRPPIEPGGICGPLIIFKVEDVLLWPAVNPVTGIISTSIQLKAGKVMYIVQAIDKGRQFEEELKYDGAGPYVDVNVEGMVPGNSSANVLTLAAAMYHRFGIICKDRSGVYRLVGNKQAGAKIIYKYTSGDGDSSRRTALQWQWQHASPAPMYQANVFNITIGNVIITAGSLTLLLRFQVGGNDAPMVNNQTTLTGSFANKKLLVLVDGIALQCNDGTGADGIDWTDPQNVIRRHYQKTLASVTITFMGGVVLDEIIEIYEIS